MVNKSDTRELLAAIKRVKCLIIVCNRVPAFETAGIAGEGDACLLSERI